MVKICTCIKKNGEQCTYKAKPSSNYCGIHKNCTAAKPAATKPAVTKPAAKPVDIVVTAKPTAKFTFLQTIAKGGFGKTSLVKDNNTDKLFVMKQSLRSNTDEIVKQYNNLIEVQKLKSVLFVQPGVIAPDKSYFTMEYLGGFTTLHYIFAEKIKIGDNIKKSWALCLLEGIRILHKAGIAHCDIKPLNIMVKGAQLKIIDFGLSRINTGSKSASGTYMYMPPEMLDKLTFKDGKWYSKSGSKEITFNEYCKYDLWATGLCLLTLCSPEYRNPIFIQGGNFTPLLRIFYKNKAVSKPFIEKYSNHVKKFYNLPCLDVLSYLPSKRRLCLP
jgi:serine/threonine protein kinase